MIVSRRAQLRSAASVIRFLTIVSVLLACGFATSIASNVLLIRGLL